MWLTSSRYLSSLVAVLGITLGSCTQDAPPQTPVACTHETPLSAGIPGSPGHLIAMAHNPNGVTELAYMMRQMLDAMKENRKALSDGKPPTPLADFTTIKCSWPTDSDTRSARFDGMADGLLEAIKAYNAKPTEPAAFNGVVSACLACHQTTCPGPMAAIRPLYWTDGQPALLELPEPQSCDHPAP